MDDIKVLQKQWKQLLRPLAAIGKPVSGDLDGMDKLEKALTKLPAGASLANAVDDLRRQTQDLIHLVRREAAQEFGKVEAVFIREQRERGNAIRELSSGWRIGPFALEVERERARARLLYNHEVLLPWRYVDSRRELDDLLVEGEELLHSVEVSVEEWAGILWEAHTSCVHRRRGQTPGRPERVPVLDLFRETRVTRIRRELATGRPDKRLKQVELPQWAFVYNVDRYHREGREVAGRHRLLFETGSQREQAAHKGLTFNGLDPRQEYKVYCFVVSTER